MGVQYFPPKWIISNAFWLWSPSLTPSQGEVFMNLLTKNQIPNFKRQK